MRKYLSRDKVLSALAAEQGRMNAEIQVETSEGAAYADGFADAIGIVSCVQAEDVAPVVHARWVWFDEDGCCCDNCDHAYYISEHCIEDFEYCPNCGAKMEDNA